MEAARVVAAPVMAALVEVGAVAGARAAEVEAVVEQAEVMMVGAVLAVGGSAAVEQMVG